MSIIHEALKKVQQKLAPKADEIEVTDETPQKHPIQNEIKSILALVCATLITIASALYIWQQFQTHAPKGQTFAQRSFDQLIHQIHPVNTKPTALAAPKPLAQLTINPPATKNPDSAKPAPVTLNIHGIMANANGNLALINDQVYQEGDDLDGAKIVKINLDSITISNNGTEQTIFVKN
jgi:type II secretory pathway component PulC